MTPKQLQQGKISATKSFMCVAFAIYYLVSLLTSTLFGLDGSHERTDRLLEQFRQTLEGHVVIRDVHSCRRNHSNVSVILRAEINQGGPDLFPSKFTESKNGNVSLVPRIRAAVGISLALIFEAQSLC